MKEMLLHVAKNWRNSNDAVLRDKVALINWREVYTLCLKHKLVGHLNYYLHANGVYHLIDESVQKDIEANLEKRGKIKELADQEFRRINEEFISKGIKTTVIKGYAFERFFPKGVRLYKDYDIIADVDQLIDIKHELEEKFGMRADIYEFFDFAKDEQRIIDGTLNFIHLVLGNDNLWLEVHPATTYWSWINTKYLHERSEQDINGIYVSDIIECFMMAVAHVWNHNPQHLQHVSHGSCKLSLYVDVREIFMYIVSHGMLKDLYEALVEQKHVEFTYEALKTCEQLFCERLIPDEFPVPKNTLDRELYSPFFETSYKQLIVDGVDETNRIKKVFYETEDAHAMRIVVSKKHHQNDMMTIDAWNGIPKVTYNNYHVEGDYFWPRRTINYFYQFYMTPIHTEFAMVWDETGLYIYGNSEWHVNVDNLEKFNFNNNYLRFMFGSNKDDKPISILLQPQTRNNASVFIGDGEYGATRLEESRSKVYFHDDKYTVIAWIPWNIFEKLSRDCVLFDVITHHQESDVPGMVAWASGMGSEKMFGCEYFANMHLAD